MLNAEDLPEMYQIGFDLAEAGSQAFVSGVREKLKEASLGPEEGMVSFSVYDIVPYIQLAEE